MTSRSDINAAPNLLVPQAGMLAYEHDSDNLYNVTYGSDEEQGYGYWHGSLNHMKIGQGKGFLISLMAERGIAGVTRPDAPEVNDETGIPVSPNTIHNTQFYPGSKGDRFLSTMSFFMISTRINGTNRKPLISMTICPLPGPVSADKPFTAMTRTPGSMLKSHSFSLRYYC